MTELMPFQLEGCRQIYNFGGRALLADDQGLGKTLQALYWILRTPKHRPVIIVTPASMKWTWQAEANLHFDLRTLVLDGRRPQGRKIKLEDPIIILNYDILHSWVKVLRRLRPATVVFDEIHYLKNPNAQRTRAASKIVQDAESVLGLSGTPIVNCPYEFWSSLNLIRPDLFPDRTEYAWEFCDPKLTRWGWRFKGATNMGRLHKILRRECMIRRLKAQVLPELPDKQRRVVVYRLKDAAQREYRRAQDDFLDWLKERSPGRAARAKKSESLTKVGYLLRLVAKLKLPWTTRWIEDFFESHPGDKLVALTMNTFVIEHLKGIFGDKAVVINGSVTGRKRTESVRLFQTSKRVNLLLGNWKAAGVGITLHAAHYGAGLDFPWTPGDLLQGEDRIHRIGQRKTCFMNYLVTMGTIEEWLMKGLKRKAKVLDAVLNGKADASELTLFEDLLEELKHHG